MEMTSALFSAFKEVTGDYKEKNKETSVIRFLDKAIKAIDGAIKGMDLFLKKKGIDVGKVYTDSKSSAKGLIEKARDALGKDEEGKSKSIYRGIKDKASDVTGRLLSKFSGFKTTGTSPPEESVNLTQPKEENQPSVMERITDKLDTLVSAMTAKKPDDTNGDGVAEEGWIEKYKNRQSKRKKEIEDEKAALLAGKKGKKKGGGPLGWIVDKLMSLGGIITGGIWAATKFLGKSLLKGIGRGLWWAGGKILTGLGGLGKHLITGFGRLLTGLVPRLSGAIASGLQGLVGAGLKNGIKGAARGALALGKAALPWVGRAAGLALRGAAMVLSGPVGWAVAVGTIVYGGYKLYKYLNRNDVADTIYGKLTRLRLLSYGFNDDNKDSYSKIFDLEMELKENLSFSGVDGKLSISKPTSEQIEKILDIFGVTPEETDRAALLNEWFTNRFIPSYHAFVKALYSVNNSVFIDDLEKLSPADLSLLMSRYSVPPKAVAHTTIPFFENTDSSVKKEDIETIIASIKVDIKSKLKDKQLKPEERMAREVAKERLNEISKKAVTVSLNKAMPKSYALPGQTRPSPSPYPIGKGPVPEGEAKPDQPLVYPMNPASNVGKLTKAGGPLIEGDISLPGITTKLKKDAILNMDPNMLNLFTGMAKEYHSLTGKSIQVNEGFRTRAEQEHLYRTLPPGRAAKPGNSLHEFGLAIDINSENTKELERLGLLRKYGFTASVGGEPWHLEPIGVSLNPSKAKTDTDFRQNAIMASIGKGGAGFGLLTGGRKGGRDIPLQRKIFESNVPEVPPKVEGKDDQLLPGVASGGVVASSPLVVPGSSISPPPPGTDIYSKLKTASDLAALSSNPKPPQGPLVKSSMTTSSPDAEGESKPSSGGFVKASMSNIGEGSSTTDLSRYGNMSPVEAIKQASAMVGIDEETLMTFGKLESGLRPNVGNKDSSASGLFQITGDTWKELVATYGPKYGIPPNADKNNPLYNALMAAEYAKANLSKVSNHAEFGVSKDVALYLTHHFGPSGGKRLLNAMGSNPDADVRSAVSASAFESNQAALRGQTVRSYIASLDNKFAVAKNTAPDAYNPNAGGGYASSVAATRPSSSSTPMGADEGSMSYASYSPSNATPTPIPQPTVTNSAYDVTRVETVGGKQNTNTAPVGGNFDTVNMESILSNQLTTLTQIATILGTINDKFDIDKLVGNLKQPNPTQPTPPQQGTKTVPSTGVSLTRKGLHA